ncbi:hypothetical protein HDV05_006431 [Chytridiales sp. JEL 0842]|nr:hypothetical protein HDV05_006431 [Chytridiales sp. JEL 0842]
MQKVTGFLKPKKIDLKDTNIAGLGTDLEKKVRLDAAQKETQWAGVGTKVGLKVWRIEDFKVVPWPEKDYGMFYSGDSYIVINTWKKPDAPTLYHDIHFWLGLSTTQDEAGTAAYKTVELDDFLGTIPIQHREVQGAESSLFLSYFANMHVQEGGVASGFNHVAPEEYVPRLFHVRANKAVKGPAGLLIREVPMSYKSLNSGDVFIADTGKEVIQWNGAAATGIEKAKAAEYSRRFCDQRQGKSKVVVYDENEGDAAFWTAIGGKGPVMSAVEADKLHTPPPFEKSLYRLSDSSGKLSFTVEAKGKVSKSKLESKDVFVLDEGQEVFVWVGKGASKTERQRSMQLAMEYISTQGRPLTLPITRIIEGNEDLSPAFVAAIA